MNSVEQFKKEEKERRDRQLDDIRVVISTEAGRRFIWRHLDRNGVFSGTFVAGSPDVTAHREGQRAAGRALLTDVEEAKPEAVFEMMREAANNRAIEKVKEDERSKNARNNDSRFYDDIGDGDGAKD